MTKKLWTLAGTILATLGGLAARWADLVTDAQLYAAGLVAGAVAGYTLLSWVFAAGVTEAARRLYFDRPEQHGGVLYSVALVAAGVPLVALLLAHFQPAGALGWVFLTIYGAAAALVAPILYRVLRPRIVAKVADNGGEDTK